MMLFLTQQFTHLSYASKYRKVSIYTKIFENAKPVPIRAHGVENDPSDFSSFGFLSEQGYKFTFFCYLKGTQMHTKAANRQTPIAS